MIVVFRVTKNDDGTLTLHYTDAENASHLIIAHYVMFATGRKPYYRDLGLEVRFQRSALLSYLTSMAGCRRRY